MESSRVARRRSAPILDDGIRTGRGGFELRRDYDRGDHRGLGAGHVLGEGAVAVVPDTASSAPSSRHRSCASRHASGTAFGVAVRRARLADETDDKRAARHRRSTRRSYRGPLPARLGRARPRQRCDRDGVQRAPDPIETRAAGQPIHARRGVKTAGERGYRTLALDNASHCEACRPPTPRRPSRRYEPP